nr:leucine-rich repeat receptor-like tyrosine-protein kinase PXC3 [Tanacetum cinerariifolium]
ETQEVQIITTEEQEGSVLLLLYIIKDLEEFDKLFLILKLLGKSRTCTVIMKGFKFAMTFINISDKPNSGSHISKAKDGSLKLFYVASKYAVDADLEADFVPISKETKVVGMLVAYYGKDFDFSNAAYLFYFLLSLLVFKYVSCDELPSSLVTTMNNLNQVLGNNTKWNPSTNPCSWSGVSCTRNNTSVTKLSLASLSISNENVDNSWSSLVCNIQTLESLDISNNQLSLIPRPFLLTSCGAGGLKALNISNNGLTGSLPTFQGPLEVLDLSRNSFDNVVIDSQFEGLNDLRSLNISNSKFRGSVPTKLGNATRLQELQLSSNSFEGRIPDQFTKYSNLTLLDLSANQLSGTIPSVSDDWVVLPTICELIH